MFVVLFDVCVAVVVRSTWFVALYPWPRLASQDAIPSRLAVAVASSDGTLRGVWSFNLCGLGICMYVCWLIMCGFTMPLTSLRSATLFCMHILHVRKFARVLA